MRSENGDAVKAIGKARMVESEKDERNSSGRNAKTYGDGRAPPPQQPPTKGSAMKKPFLVAREKWLSGSGFPSDQLLCAEAELPGAISLSLSLSASLPVVCQALFLPDSPASLAAHWLHYFSAQFIRSHCVLCFSGPVLCTIYLHTLASLPCTILSDNSSDLRNKKQILSIPVVDHSRIPKGLSLINRKSSSKFSQIVINQLVFRSENWRIERKNWRNNAGEDKKEVPRSEFIYRILSTVFSPLSFFYCISLTVYYYLVHPLSLAINITIFLSFLFPLVFWKCSLIFSILSCFPLITNPPRSAHSLAPESATHRRKWKPMDRIQRTDFQIHRPWA